MEKKINSRTVAQVKSIFKFNEKNYADLAKVNVKLEKLNAEKAALESAIELAEQPIINMFGYKSGDLIEAVVTPLFNEDGTPKMDAEGKYQQKTKKYVAKYGEAFLPTVEETSTCEVECNGSDSDIDLPMPETGNDFDADAANTNVIEPTL